jgi:group I intron endonuclease
MDVDVVIWHTTKFGRRRLCMYVGFNFPSPINSSMNYSIYKLTNKLNGKIYIGYSQCPDKRWSDHQKAAIKGYKGVLYNAMRKYGIENFTFEVIYVNSSKTKTKNIMEPKLIKEYNSLVPNGYNVAHGGDGGSTRCGAILSDETKRKISENTRKGMADPELRKHLSKQRKKRITKDITRLRMSEAKKTKRWYSHHELQQAIFREESDAEELLSQGWVQGRLYGFDPLAWRK